MHSHPLLRGRNLLLVLCVVSFVGYWALFQKEVQQCVTESGAEREGIGEREKGTEKERELSKVEKAGEIKAGGGIYAGGANYGGPTEIDKGGRKSDEKEGGKADKECGKSEFSGLSASPYLSPFFITSDPTVCILTRTYHGHTTVLPAFIASVASNNYPNVHVFLLDTEDTFQNMGRFADLFNSLYGKSFVHAPKITKQEARGRFPNWTEPFDFGYIQTDILMRQLSANSSEYKCDYFLVTNGDNLYTRDFFHYTVGALRQQIDLIAVEFVSHYCYEKSVPWRPRPGCYSQVYSEIKMSHIDLGAAMFRKDKVVELDASFILYFLERDPTGNGLQADFSDGYFFEFLQREGASIQIVNSALFVHQ